MLNLDRLNIHFMFIGFAGTVLIAGLVGILENVKYSFILIAIFVAVLLLVFHRNNKELTILRQSHILNMAILIYLEN